MNASKQSFFYVFCLPVFPSFWAGEDGKGWLNNKGDRVKDLPHLHLCYMELLWAQQKGWKGAKFGLQKKIIRVKGMKNAKQDFFIPEKNKSPLFISFFLFLIFIF